MSDKEDKIAAKIEEKKRETTVVEPVPKQISKQHDLAYEYNLWHIHLPPSVRTNQTCYEDNIKKIGSFKTVEEFWGVYNHLKRPHELPSPSDYHVFKSGIKPIWEDESNKRGGKMVIRMKKGLATRFWEEVLLAVIGEQFDVGDEICGIVVSVRYQGDIISIWNKSATNRNYTYKIRETMKKVLQLPFSSQLEYKPHDASIKDNAHYRSIDETQKDQSRDPRYPPYAKRNAKPEWA